MSVLHRTTRLTLYFLCVRGPARTLVCCCLWPRFCQTYTVQRQGDHAFTAWCFDRNIQNGHFSLFWNRFETRLRLHICGLRGPENGHFSLFWNRFETRLRLHICMWWIESTDVSADSLTRFFSIFFFKTQNKLGKQAGLRPLVPAMHPPAISPRSEHFFTLVETDHPSCHVNSKY